MEDYELKYDLKRNQRYLKHLIDSPEELFIEHRIKLIKGEKIDLNRDEILKNFWEKKEFPTYLHYVHAWSLWEQLEGGTNQYNHTKLQFNLMKHPRVKEMMNSHLEGKSAFIIGPGYSGASETTIVSEMGNLEKIFVLDASSELLVNSSLNISHNIEKKTGEKPFIYAYRDLIENLPNIVPVARNMLPESHPAFSFIMLGNINDQIDGITLHDNKPLRILGKVAQVNETIIYSSHQFDEITEWDIALLNKQYGSDAYRKFVTYAPGLFGIPIKQEDGAMFSTEFDKEAGAQILFLTLKDYPNTRFKLYRSEKHNHKSFKNTVHFADVKAAEFIRDKKSSLAVNVLISNQTPFTKVEDVELEKIFLETFENEPVRNESERFEFYPRVNTGQFLKICDRMKKTLRERLDYNSVNGHLNKNEKLLDVITDTQDLLKSNSLNGIYFNSGILNPAERFIYQFLEREDPIIIKSERVKSKCNGRLLIIDDNEEIDNSLGNFLRGQGFEINFALGGIEGQQMIKDSLEKKVNGNPAIEYDGVIADLKMEPINGLEIINYVKNELKLDIPVFMHSGHNTAYNATLSIQSGAKGFFPKPMNLFQMADEINKSLLK